MLLSQSNDTKPVEFAVSREAAKMSGLIKDMLEDQEQEENAVIPVPNVNGRTLKYVIQYMEVWGAILRSYRKLLPNL